jgi:predicted short-subunit dehydrogenase-like oxidoreductase (DUF2520 family)
MKEHVAIIGCGTVGTALGRLLGKAGYPIVGISTTRGEKAARIAEHLGALHASTAPWEVTGNAGLIFITTPDDVIGQVCGETRWREGQSVVHCSGAHSVDILEPARKAGAAVGSFHPLQTFADVNQAVENLPGSTFALEAGEPLFSLLKELALLLNGNWVELKPGDKVLYHAAAVFACNYLVTLVKLAVDLWQNFGVSSEDATRALLPLLEGTVNNIGNVGLPGCLTGPVARGDLGTIQRHLTALEARSPSLLSMYSELGLYTIPISLAKGKIDERKAQEMQALLSLKTREASPRLGGRK